MKEREAERRIKARIYRAKLAIEKDRIAIRLAAIRFHMPYKTYENMRKKESSGNVVRPPALTSMEEKTVFDTLTHYTDCGLSLTRSDARDAIALMI